jgi:aspartate/methionine/tyrosine aminotransferase
MTMTQTSSAKVEWNPDKKHWQVVIQAGAEVIRRQCAKTPPDAGDPELRALAIKTARDEGYTLDEAQVSIAH